MPDILPDSRPIVQRQAIAIDGIMSVPIYCANCGCAGGWVPEANMTFAFYLCNRCAEKWTPLVDTMLVPDEVFWARVREEQINRYGRLLDNQELVALLEDDHSSLSLLGKDKPDFNKRKMS